MDNRRAIIALIFLGAVLFFSGLGERDLWDIDEGMHAVIAQNMLLDSDWITPRFNDQAFLDKPPLFNWLTAISFVVLGFTALAARVPAALSGLLTVLLVYGIGRRLYSTRTGLLAGIVAATSLEFVVLARSVQYDMPFALFTTLAIYAYLRAIQEHSVARWYVWLFYAAVGGSVLTKGPLGAVLVGLGVVPHLVVLKDRQIWRRLLDPVGLLLFTAISASWYAAMEAANPGYLEYFFVRQHVANVLGDAAGYVARHPEPFYYYALILFGALFPWSLTLTQALYRVAGSRDAAVPRAEVMLTAFVVGAILVLSAATSKLANYVLPVIPIAAVPIGRYWDRLLDARNRGRIAGYAIGLGATGIAFFAIVLFVFLDDPLGPVYASTGVTRYQILTLLTGIAALCLMSAAFAARAQHLGAALSLAIVTPFTIAMILIAIGPALNTTRSSHDIAAIIDQRLADDEPLYFYGRLLDSAMFYTGRESVMLETEDDFRRKLQSDKKVYVAVLSRSGNWDDVPSAPYFVVARIGNKAIVSNMPDNPSN